MNHAIKAIAHQNKVRRWQTFTPPQNAAHAAQRACRLVNQPRGTQRYLLTQREDEDALTRAIVELASQYGRYGSWRC